MHINTLKIKHRSEFLEVYEAVFSSKEEVNTFYGRFIENGWISGAWVNKKLVGIITWAPRESVKYGLAEIVDFWVKDDDRRRGIGGKLIDHALVQIQQYFKRFGATLNKVMLFTGSTDRFLAARILYEKKGFQVVATIPKNALDNPYGDDLLYVLHL